MSSGNDRLDDALRALAKETESCEASPRVKHALLAEVRSVKRKRQMARWWPAVAAAAAALVIGIWIGRPHREPVEQPVVETAGVTAAEPELSVPEPKPVIEERETRVPPRARLARRSEIAAPSPATPWYINAALPPVRQGQVVLIDVGPETVRQFGFPADGQWKAEVFLGDDGMARAMRLVRVPKMAKGELVR